MTRTFPLNSLCPRNQGLNGLVRGGFGPAFLCEVRKVRGLKHHKGVDGVKTRLTGARAETSGHLLFGLRKIGAPGTKSARFVIGRSFPYILFC